MERRENSQNILDGVTVLADVVLAKSVE
jgi:hypothetical protein